MMVHVTKTYLPDKKKYQSYIDKIFQSGWVTNHGPLLQHLESELKKYLGVDNLLIVANGTLALQVAYKALSLQGEVITTPFSFAATTSSLVWEGLQPRFVDIDRDTLCLDPAKVEAAINEKTSAIVPVHIYGNGCEVEALQKIADRHGVKLIFDASHAFGVRYKDRSILSFGDISTLSFHATKIFHTCEGGALVIRDDAVFQEAKKMLDFGITEPETIEGLGINAKMNEFEAAMGLCLLDDIDQIQKNRKLIYDHYINILPRELTLPKWNKNCNNNYSYFPILFTSEELLLNVMASLNKKKIFPRRYFLPSLDSLCYIRNGPIMTVSRDISKRILCLPLFDSMDITIADDIIKIINRKLD